MNELQLNNNMIIENMIYEIRGKQVMLDSDLARLYQCANGTKTINQAVNRHIKRFPKDFYFQINELEFSNLKSQAGTSSLNNYGGIRKLPYVFTEQGVAMLATILRTSVAEEISVNIMRAFVAMRKYISTSLIEQKYVNELVFKHEERINMLEETFSKFDAKKKINEIYFNGQIYDAYSKLIDIMKEAKQCLTIIDGYADKTVLDMIANLTVKTILIVKNKGLLKRLDIEKYNEQYNNLTIIFDDTFHDRYLIIDEKTIYHCGSSINYAGNRTFSINLLEDDIVKTKLINYVNKKKAVIL